MCSGEVDFVDRSVPVVLTVSEKLCAPGIELMAMTQSRRRNAALSNNCEEEREEIVMMILVKILLL